MIGFDWRRLDWSPSSICLNISFISVWPVTRMWEPDADCGSGETNATGGCFAGNIVQGLRRRTCNLVTWVLFPGHQPANQAVHPSGIDKLVAVADSGWSLLKIANVSAYGCTMAWMWLTLPVARLPHAGFLQLYNVVLEFDSIFRCWFELTFTSYKEHETND